MKRRKLNDKGLALVLGMVIGCVIATFFTCLIADNLYGVKSVMYPAFLGGGVSLALVWLVIRIESLK